MPIIGLDVGDKSLGIAISDPSNTIARGIKTIRGKDFSLSICLEYLEELVKQYKIKKIVVGLPKNNAGEEGKQAQKVRLFINNLQSRINVAVIPFDERFSSVSAERVLKEGKVGFSQRKKLRDKVAAIIILQNYLDSERQHH